MDTSAIIDARVAVAGYGAEGSAVVRALRRWGNPHEITVLADGPIPASTEGLRWSDAAGAAGALRGCDVLVKSPGIPPHHPIMQAAREVGLPITSGTNLYIERTRGAGLPVIGITGSKGKSTTTTLIHRALVAGGVDAELVGNIGLPALDAVDLVVSRRATSVFEMSSYQCDGLTLGPSIAVLVSLFPEHLDWHGSREAYYAAKLRITETQRPGDVLVANLSSATVAAHLPRGPARLVPCGTADALRFQDGTFFDRDTALFPDTGFQLPGEHNRLNACAALAVAREVGVPLALAWQAMQGFTGLPHRCEQVGEFAGIRWINDAISTAPEAASAALDAFRGQVSTLIAGGHDRGYEFSGLARDILRHGVRSVAVLAPSGLALARAIEQARGAAEVSVIEAEDLAKAVAWAAQQTPPGRTCLFSPASPSYGRYKNFQERGEHFRALVRALAAG